MRFHIGKKCWDLETCRKCFLIPWHNYRLKSGQFTIYNKGACSAKTWLIVFSTLIEIQGSMQRPLDFFLLKSTWCCPVCNAYFYVFWYIAQGLWTWNARNKRHLKLKFEASLWYRNLIWRIKVKCPVLFKT